jgi:hypothetical protein
VRAVLRSNRTLIGIAGQDLCRHLSGANVAVWPLCAVRRSGDALHFSSDNKASTFVRSGRTPPGIVLPVCPWVWDLPILAPLRPPLGHMGHTLALSSLKAAVVLFCLQPMLNITARGTAFA